MDGVDARCQRGRRHAGVDERRWNSRRRIKCERRRVIKVIEKRAPLEFTPYAAINNQVDPRPDRPYKTGADVHALFFGKIQRCVGSTRRGERKRQDRRYVGEAPRKILTLLVRSHCEEAVPPWNRVVDIANEIVLPKFAVLTVAT